MNITRLGMLSLNSRISTMRVSSSNPFIGSLSAPSLTSCKRTWRKLGGAKRNHAEPVPLHSVVLVNGPNATDKLILEPPLEKLPIVSMSAQVDAFLAERSNVSINYVHGEEPVMAACADETTAGLLLPKLDKTRFLETVHDIGTLPRKAFSMGEANEKRFYMEARNILPEGPIESKL